MTATPWTLLVGESTLASGWARKADGKRGSGNEGQKEQGEVGSLLLVHVPRGLLSELHCEKR